MSSFEIAGLRSFSATRLSDRLTRPVFTASILLSALLLFAIEPMFTKMVLPILGGSPSVWSVAMIFFQGLMFAGYLYAHALTRYVPARIGALIHLMLLAATVLTLPVVLRLHGAPPVDNDPALWLMGTFGLSVGLPFFALSAHGPLLQAWFARSGSMHAHDPYFLYGASNIGSFAALIAYPLVIEPLFGLTAQGRGWMFGFVALATLVAAAASIALRSASRDVPTPADRPSDAIAATPARPSTYLAWLGLAFVPSGLLVSVTAHLSTDVAAAPLFWVLPLGLYLLTFVVTFRAASSVSDPTLACLQAWGAAFVLMNIGMKDGSVALSLVAHLALFFVNGLICHRALYRLRPDARDLTSFYVVLSLGGVLGGLFAGLVAPRIFSTIAEYPLLIVAALFCRPGALTSLPTTTPRDHLRAVVGISILVIAGIAAAPHVGADVAQYFVCGGFGLMMLLDWRQPHRVAVAGGLAAVYLTLLHGLISPLESWRSFFGVNRIEIVSDGKFRVLQHGTTLHGAMRIRNADGTVTTGAPQPTTYYWRSGPIGEAIRAARTTHGGTLHQVSVIGLGVGALACHVAPGEPISFYEIDPVVVHLASDPAYFRFLSVCAPDARIVTGDARLTLAAQRNTSSVIVVDAFSSDAIPVHLLTREALALYVSKLDARGFVVLHISNNKMAFSRIIARAAADLGLVTYIRSDLSVDPNNADMRTASVAVVVARDPADLGPLLTDGKSWRPVVSDPQQRPWTDDYSTVLPAIVAKWRGEQ